MNVTDGFSTTTEEYHPINSTNGTTWATIFYTYANIISIILSLPANCYVVWLMLTGKGTGFVSDFTGLNLAVCEIFYCVGSLISFCISSLPGYFLLTSFIAVFPVLGRPLFLCLICVERYVAVVHPVTFLKFKPLRYKLACSAIVWTIVAGFGVFCMFTLSSFNLQIFLGVVLPQYSLFLTVKLFCCLAILKALKHPGPGDGKQREEANHMKRRAFTIILILTVTMVINYSPLFVAGLCFGLLPIRDFMAFWTISVTICMIVAFVQPCMYIQKFGNLTAVSRMFYSLISLKL